MFERPRPRTGKRRPSPWSPRYLDGSQHLSYASLGRRFSGDGARPRTRHHKAEQIASVVSQVESHFGSIDVLVNNAGVGYLAAVEEGEEKAIRGQFETNFFGAAALIRAVLPGMRKRKHGTIVNISSVAGFVSFAGMGYYAASKFALEGLTEALWQELEPLGISVLLIEPGGFRTGMVKRNWFSEQIAAYANTSGAFRNFVQNAGDGLYPGDPKRATDVIVTMVETDKKPRRIVLGSDAYAAITAKLHAAPHRVRSGVRSRPQH